MKLVYYNPSQLMLVNSKGQIRVLYTPFRVLCIVASGRIPLNTWVYVDLVLGTHHGELQYVIFGIQHPFQYFKLPITF